MQGELCYLSLSIHHSTESTRKIAYGHDLPLRLDQEAHLQLKGRITGAPLRGQEADDLPATCLHVPRGQEADVETGGNETPLSSGSRPPPPTGGVDRAATAPSYTAPSAPAPSGAGAVEDGAVRRL